MRSNSKRIPCFDRKRSSRISRDSATSTGRIDEPAAAMMSVNYFTGCKNFLLAARDSLERAAADALNF
jgi:hypothetical protein